ncbi:MAG: phosphotransferase [Flavobacteriaceae bacterium]|nr:phosphotransferase [Flavobacteriaceae bacterium]
MDSLTNKVQEKLSALYRKWSDDEIVKIEKLPASGSARCYYRIEGKKQTALGVYNADYKENRAFLEFSKHFKREGMPIPEIYAEDLDNSTYLIEDLGAENLFEHILSIRNSKGFSEELKVIYRKILEDLVQFQLYAGRELPYKYCYPRAKFDKQSMLWDLHYFKYYFLKLAQIPFDEQALEDDFHTFADYLLETEQNYFLYRDFQSRNIMLKDGKPAYIDYQGGRKGALQYDVASLLYDAKADMPEEVREEMLDYYVEVLQREKEVDTKAFRTYYYGYVLVRIMQAMGAYGFRGFYEKKEHFLQSIPFAMENLKVVLKKANLPIEIPQLLACLEQVANSEKLLQIAEDAQPRLQVEINSFSYKRGIPIDKSDNGGGFVFDCRAIHNPGRYEQYKNLTGRDDEVIQFFENEEDMKKFLTPIKQLVSMSVERYIQRNFRHLQINFGCTGGRHRSVYATDQVALFLRENYNIKVCVRHIEREIEDKNWKR